MMNFYTLHFHFCLVDLMGYGFVKVVDKKVREYWMNFMKKYFTTRLESHLKHVFVLIDTDYFVTREKKHADNHRVLSSNDHEMLTFLDDCYVPYSLILTKIDCVNNTNYVEHESGTKVYNRNVNDCSKFDKIMNDLVPIFDQYGMIQPFVNVTSSRLGFGITELQCIMAYLTQLFEKDDQVNLGKLDMIDVLNKHGEIS